MKQTVLGNYESVLVDRRAYATTLRLSLSSSVQNVLIVAKEQMLLLTAYRKSYVRNRLVPK